MKKEVLVKNFLVVTILLSLCCGAGGEEKQVTEPKPEAIQKSKHVLMVIAPKNFRDEEFKEPYELLNKSGMKVTVASTDTTPATGMLGAVVKPNITLEQVKADSFDCLIIVGGSGCKVLWDDTLVHKIAGEFNDVEKPIAAICIAPVVLGKAGLLKGKKVTAFPSVKEQLEECEAVYTDAALEKSGNIITCSGPESAKEFAEEILKALTE